MQPITINDEVKEMLITKFKEKINKTSFGNTSIDFSLNLNEIINKEDIVRPKIYITATAYLKMMMYVRDTSTEIAWHGTVERYPERHAYYIKDVFLYPQKIAAATVQTDQDKYNKWMEELDDETYNHLRFQGHSHVNFSVTPSGTDLAYYNDILSVLPKNDYYIFMILNKSGDTTFLICDLEKNLIYETADIDVQIVTHNTDNVDKVIKDEKELYCEKPVVYSTTHYGYDYSDYYKKHFDAELNRDMPDVNDLLDDIDKKYPSKTLTKFKNPKLSIVKNNKKK